MTNAFKRIVRPVMLSPISRIISGIVLLNVGLFIQRNLVQLALSALAVENEILISTFIFAIRILGLIFIYTLLVKAFEGRKPAEIAIKKATVKQLTRGAEIGILCIGFIFGMNWLSGWVSVENVNESPDILEGIYYTVFFVLLQDFVHFLILFRITEKYLGTYLTILICGLIFGFKHSLFPDYTFISGIIIFIDVTFIFSALFLWSRSLWEIFGFHLAYNITQNIILGNPSIAGIQSVLKLSVNGPAILAGDPSGFETSIIAVTFCIGVGGYLLNVTRNQGWIMKPYWIKKINPP